MLGFPPFFQGFFPGNFSPLILRNFGGWEWEFPGVIPRNWTPNPMEFWGLECGDFPPFSPVFFLGILPPNPMEFWGRGLSSKSRNSQSSSQSFFPSPEHPGDIPGGEFQQENFPGNSQWDSHHSRNFWLGFPPFFLGNSSQECQDRHRGGSQGFSPPQIPDREGKSWNSPPPKSQIFLL